MIENRDLTNCELTYVLESQMELRKDPLYSNLLARKQKLENDISESIRTVINSNNGASIVKFVETIGELRKLDFDIGFWDGEMFARIRSIRSKEYE